MQLRSEKSRQVLSKGFTIVELLVVIIVIAILATITIIGYNSITNRAKNAVIDNDISTISKKINEYQAVHSAYPDSLPIPDVSADYAEKYHYARSYNGFCLSTKEGGTEALRHIDMNGRISDGSCVPSVACLGASVVGGAIHVTGYEPSNAGSNTSACRNDVMLPSTAQGAVITTIGPGAFDSKGLTELYLESGITTIQDNAFAQNDLKSVYLPNSVTAIGVSSFFGNQLESLKLSEQMTIIPHNAFAQNKLTSVVIPGSVTQIGPGAFHTNELTSITIPSSVTAIGQGAFGHNKISALHIPSSVRQIDRDAFADNHTIAQLTIDEGLQTIGERAFAHGTFSTVTVPRSVTTIGAWAFLRPEGNPVTCRIPTTTAITSTGCSVIIRY